PRPDSTLIRRVGALVSVPAVTLSVAPWVATLLVNSIRPLLVKPFATVTVAAPNDTSPWTRIVSSGSVVSTPLNAVVPRTRRVPKLSTGALTVVERIGIVNPAAPVRVDGPLIDEFEKSSAMLPLESGAPSASVALLKVTSAPGLPIVPPL